MPDVWTTNPEKLKKVLLECGGECGVEARVLKPRDPEWTCYMDTASWKKDIYIHDVRELLMHGYYSNWLILVAGISLLLGVLWGSLRFGRDFSK